MNPEMNLSRRDILKFVGLSATSALLAGCNAQILNPENRKEWPIDEGGILARIRELKFAPNSLLGTTFFPRKMMWEMAQVQKAKGTWRDGQDESDWLNHLNLIESSLDLLSSMGIQKIRLEVVPFELTQDGKTYDWTPVDMSIALVKKYRMSPDLCVGPLDYPYDPGIRLPKYLQDMVSQEIERTGQKDFTISTHEDTDYPVLSRSIIHFSQEFISKILERYGKDSQIGKFYIGNEWPDKHGVEGVDATMSFSQSYMKKMVEIADNLTAHPIALNTNIYPSEKDKIKSTFAWMSQCFGDRNWVLGFDTYPTQEKQFSSKGQYKDLINGVRAALPKAKLNFTEFQAEPWPPENLAGKSWYEIFTSHPQLVKDFFLKSFPSTLESRIIAGNIGEVNLWGAPLWPVLQAQNYDFPQRMIKTIAETIGKNN